MAPISRCAPARRQRLRDWMPFAVCVLLAAGCGPAGQRGTGNMPGDAPQFGRGFFEKGYASWYGAELAGRPTASGKPFNPRGMSAAHRILPFGTLIQVKNLENGRCVVLPVNDRGPFVPGRVLDCSDGAARALGFRSQGLTRVAIKLPRGMTRQEIETGEFWVQFGVFQDAKQARQLQARLACAPHPAQVHVEGDLLLVRSGPYDGLPAAEKARRKLARCGLNGCILRLDRDDEAAAR